MATVRAHTETPGLSMAVADSEGRVRVFVSGTRSNQNSTAVRPSDSWHIGSNTKALTALLFARLAEENIVDWDQPLPTFFPDLKSQIDPGWNTITIKDLFSHRSGMRSIISSDVDLLSDAPLTDLRQTGVVVLLGKPPSRKIGKFHYSNLNYVVAGAAIEAALSREFSREVSWEEAMQTYIFDAVPNLKARMGWGFGPPEHVEGHKEHIFKSPVPVGKGEAADNHPVLGPAGTLHAAPGPHALLLAEFLRMDPSFLPRHQRDILWEPYPDDEIEYAMGWSIDIHTEYGPIYIHNGSNTYWYSVAIIAPDLDRAVVVNANLGIEYLITDLAFSALRVPLD
ncbi:MAG: serine hydrolase domain-containing protein [Pseudomonadota bacterium]